MDNNSYREKRERNITRKKENEKQNFLTRVIIVQFVLSLLITGVLYGVCHTESNLSQNIKVFYGEISQKDIAISALVDTVKNVVKQTFSPKVESEKTVEGKDENIAGEGINFSPAFHLVKMYDI